MNEHEINQGIGISEESGAAFSNGGIELGSAGNDFDPFGGSDFADGHL